MLNTNAEVITSKQMMLNLWKHECTRVIADRFINIDDGEWFEKTLKAVISEDFGSDSVALLHDEPYFVDFMRDAPELTGYYFHF